MEPGRGLGTAVVGGGGPVGSRVRLVPRTTSEVEEAGPAIRHGASGIPDNVADIFAIPSLVDEAEGKLARKSETGTPPLFSGRRDAGRRHT
jgi:hypothetical protein